MNGPQHYIEAEKLLRAARDCKANDDARLLVALAQVHATLAQAAATAYPAVRDYYGDETTATRSWAEVAE